MSINIPGITTFYNELHTDLMVNKEINFICEINEIYYSLDHISLFMSIIDLMLQYMLIN